MLLCGPIPPFPKGFSYCWSRHIAYYIQYYTIELKDIRTKQQFII